MSIPENPLRILFEMKGDKVRWNLLGADPSGGYRVLDAAARRLFTVDPMMTSVVVGDLATSASPAPPAASAWVVSPHGEGSVGGYPCGHVRVTRGDDVYDVCVAMGMPEVPLAYAFPGVDKDLPFLAALAGRGGMPLSAAKVEVADGGRERLTRVLGANQVRPGPIDPARFALPNVPMTTTKQFAPRGPRLR